MFREGCFIVKFMEFSTAKELFLCVKSENIFVALAEFCSARRCLFDAFNGDWCAAISQEMSASFTQLSTPTRFNNLMLMALTSLSVSVNETRENVIINKSQWKLLSGGAVCYLHKVVPTFGFVDELRMCNNWNESYQAVLFCGTVCFAYYFHESKKIFNFKAFRTELKKIRRYNQQSESPV